MANSENERGAGIPPALAGLSTDPLDVISQAILPWLVYFLPLLLALILRKRRWVLIGFIDLFLGWTIIGWIISLVLAMTWRKRPPVVWDGVHRVTIGGAGGTLPLWVARCSCGWQTSSFSYAEVQAAGNIFPHPTPRQPYYAGPG
jgi:hypothetical protein